MAIYPNPKIEEAFEDAKQQFLPIQGERESDFQSRMKMVLSGVIQRGITASSLAHGGFKLPANLGSPEEEAQKIFDQNSKRTPSKDDIRQEMIRRGLIPNG